MCSPTATGSIPARAFSLATSLAGSHELISRSRSCNRLVVASMARVALFKVPRRRQTRMQSPSAQLLDGRFPDAPIEIGVESPDRYAVAEFIRVLPSQVYQGLHPTWPLTVVEEVDRHQKSDHDPHRQRPMIVARRCLISSPALQKSCYPLFNAQHEVHQIFYLPRC